MQPIPNYLPLRPIPNYVLLRLIPNYVVTTNSQLCNCWKAQLFSCLVYTRIMSYLISIYHMQPNLTVRKFSLPPSLNLSTGYTYVLAVTQQFLLVAHFRVYHQIWFSKNVEIQPRVTIFSFYKKYLHSSGIRSLCPMK